MNHVTVSPTDGNGPTQGQRKTLTRVRIEPTTKQNGERYPPNLLYFLVCVINCYLRETGGEDALNFINKAHKRKVNCYLMVVIEMSNL